MKKFQAKRIISAFLLAAMLVSTVVITGCQKKTASESQLSSSTGPVTLDVYSWTVVDSMKPFFDAFAEKYPNIKLKYTKMNDAVNTTANVLLTSGVNIDCIPQASVDDTRLRAQNGMYYALDGFLKQDKIDYSKTFGEGVNAIETVNGKHYAIPYSVATYGLYYNKSIFDKAGVSYPTDNWTWDDLKAAALKLTSGSGAGKIYGFLPDYVNQWDFPAIEQLGLNYCYSKDGKTSTWNNAAFLDSLKFFYDMETKDKSAWPLSEYKALKIDTNPHAIFLQGKVAMYLAGSYAPKYSSQASYGFTGFEFGCVNMPKVKSSDGLKNIFNISDYSIPAGAKNKQAAWTYIKFYSMEAPEIFAQAKAMVPANVGVLDSATKESVGKIMFNYPHFDQATGVKTFITDFSANLTSQLTTISTAKSEINDMVKTEVTSCFLGNETPEQAIANMKKNADDLIKKADNQ